MAAGLGFKTFTTGEVLTAADTNGYLMQGILVFATEAARNSAITSPQEGQFAFTKDTNSLWYYTGSAWAASGATGDIEGVTAGTGISGGGTSGTVTITNSMATAIDAKGDLVVGTGADTFSRLAVGTNGQVLTADSGEATGLKFATPSAASGPAFSVYKASNQTLTVSTFTKITWSNEEFDTAGDFASDKFTPQTAGYYQINATLNIDLSGGSGTIQGRLYKNGANYCELFRQNTNYGTGSGSTLVYMNGSSDYLEIYAQGNAGTPVVFGGSTLTQFNGVWIRS